MSYQKKRISRIIDGDTFETNDNTIVRIAGLNTPERNEEGYHKAKWALKRLIPIGSWVNLYPKERDRYGRLVAIVYNRIGKVSKQMKNKGFRGYYQR